jgi:hypothetical protein
MQKRPGGLPEATWQKMIDDGVKLWGAFDAPCRGYGWLDLRDNLKGN